MTNGTWPPRCVECNKFMSYDEMERAVVYGPYGGYFDDEPPPDRFIHRACWNVISDDRRETIERIAYTGPYVR